VAAEGGRKMKRIISGVLALTLLTSLGLAGASCVPIVEAKTGTVEVRVTDDRPGYEIQQIEMSVLSVEIHKAEEEEEQHQNQGQNNQNQEGDGGWMTLDILDDINPFILTDLQNGEEQTLALGQVDTGKYTQIRMEIDWVEVTYTYLQDGETEETTVEAKLPSGKLKFVRPFEVDDGETTVLLFDFDADKSVVFTGATKNEQVKVIFKPVVKLSIQQGKPHQLASVEGTISAVDTEESTVSIIPTDGTEDDTIVLNVNLQQTEITLDDVDVSLNELAELVDEEKQDTVTATALYYLNNLKATQIDAMPPP
jgi:hypothetical protein